MSLVVAGLFILAGLVFALWRNMLRKRRLDSAKAAARRWIELLAAEMTQLTDKHPVARQALADAADRLSLAISRLADVTKPEHAHLARKTALEGYYRVQAARLALGRDA